MLKERDKKLLFYSWSYGILAAALIYACCGYGVMAYTLLHEFDIAGSSTATTPAHLDLYNYSQWGTDITRITWEGGCNNVGGNMPASGTHTLTMQKTTNKGNLSWSYTKGSVGSGWQDCTMTFDAIDFAGTLNGDYDLLFANATPWAQSLNVNYSAGPPDEPYTAVIKGHAASTFLSGHWSIYGGSAAPDAPVINDFTSDASCYNPGEAIVLESNVTGSVDSWLWEIYDSSDTSVFSSTDSVETIVDETFAPGLYQVQLYVENTGGSDFLSKEDWLNVTTAGGCLALNNWSPFPTITTVTPTQGIFETMTMPPHIVTNLTGINEEINQSIFGNMSQGYRDYFDYIGEQANTTFTGTFRTLLSPVTQIVNGIAAGISLFSSAFTALQGYTTVPLGITAIVINYMPWQIVTLITAGIAIDAILILILGR